MIIMDLSNNFYDFIQFTNSIVVFNKLNNYIMIYFDISLFCTAFPVVFVLVLFILTLKWLCGAGITSRPPARFSSKPKRSRPRQTTDSKINTVCNRDISNTLKAHLHLPVSTKLPENNYKHIAIMCASFQDESKKFESNGVIFVVERRLQRPCLV